jgi:hypothetical protein
MLVLYIKKHGEITAYNTLFTKEEITVLCMMRLHQREERPREEVLREY